MKILKTILGVCFIIGAVLIALNIVIDFNDTLFTVAGFLAGGGGFLLALLGGIGNNDNNNEK